MKPGDILTRGRTAFWEGRHAEALRDFIWFHENALKQDRSYYGVRLSFALAYWKELADVYPPALRAFESMRARAVSALRSGAGDRDLFHDVVAMNREMGQSRETYDLFRALKAAHPELAKTCRYLAAEAIVAAGDFKLAAECLPHPESYLLWLSDRLNGNLELKNAPRGMARRQREAFVHNYCQDVDMMLRILKGLGNGDAARAAREWSVALVRSKAARDMVAAWRT